MFGGRVQVAASAIVVTVLLAACGGSSSGGGSATSTTHGSGDASSHTAKVATATAAVEKYTRKPTAFPVDQPLKTRPTGKIFAYLECSTPVCGLFAQLLQPTQKLLGYKLTVTKAGASASSLQSAMQSIISEKPSGILVPASTPQQFASQLKQAAQAKIPMTANGIMDPARYGFGGAVFDQRLSLLAGKLIADWVISRDGSKSNAVFYNIPELDFTSYVEKGYKLEMARLCPSCVNRYVPIPVATVGNTAPTQVVDDLQSHPSTKTVVFASGETATGLPAALKASGLTVQSIGFAPNPTVLQYIKQGQITEGLGLDLATMIWTQTDELARLVAHEPLTTGEKAGDVPIQFLSAKSLPGSVAQGWAAYPNFAQRFAAIWSGK